MRSGLSLKTGKLIFGPVHTPRDWFASPVPGISQNRNMSLLERVRLWPRMRMNAPICGWAALAESSFVADHRSPSGSIIWANRPGSLK